MPELLLCILMRESHLRILVHVLLAKSQRVVNPQQFDIIHAS